MVLLFWLLSTRLEARAGSRVCRAVVGISGCSGLTWSRRPAQLVPPTYFSGHRHLRSASLDLLPGQPCWIHLVDQWVADPVLGGSWSFVVGKSKEAAGRMKARARSPPMVTCHHPQPRLALDAAKAVGQAGHPVLHRAAQRGPVEYMCFDEVNNFNNVQFMLASANMFRLANISL